MSEKTHEISKENDQCVYCGKEFEVPYSGIYKTCPEHPERKPDLSTENLQRRIDDVIEELQKISADLYEVNYEKQFQLDANSTEDALDRAERLLDNRESDSTEDDMSDEIMKTEDLADLVSALAVSGKVNNLTIDQLREEAMKHLGPGVFVPKSNSLYHDIKADQSVNGGEQSEQEERPDADRYKFANNEGTHDDFSSAEDSGRDKRIIGQTEEEVIAERFLAGEAIMDLEYDYGKTAPEILDAIREHVELKEQEETCEWSYDKSTNYLHTECNDYYDLGRRFANYCPKCERKIVVVEEDKEK